MTKSLEQQLSELIDDELDATERDRLVKSFKKDPRLVERWERYHLISDALRNNLPDRIDHGLAERVRASIDLEPTLLVPSKYGTDDVADAVQAQESAAGRRRWFIPAAAAASVAFVALVGVQLNTELNGRSPSMSAENAAQVAPAGNGVQLAATPQQSMPPHLPQSSPVAPAQGQWLRAEVPGGSQLNNYLVDHSEFSLNAGVPGMFPYARVVSHEPAGSQ